MTEQTSFPFDLEVQHSISFFFLSEKLIEDIERVVPEPVASL